MMKRRAMHGSSTAMCARLCAWPRDWRGLMPRPARPSRSATTRPPPRKSALPPGAPAVVATTTANPPPNPRSSPPAANGGHSTARARNGGPLEAPLPEPDRDALQLLRRRFGPQTQVFADSPPARGGQVAPLTQDLQHTELPPFGCQLTGLDLLVQAPAGTVAGQAPAHLAQRHYHLIPPRLLQDR